jgi:hypothetical protein
MMRVKGESLVMVMVLGGIEGQALLLVCVVLQPSVSSLVSFYM